jgi:signal peptidase I
VRNIKSKQSEFPSGPLTARFWKDNQQFFLILTFIVFFKSAIADLSSISGASMQPTLLDGDKIWVNKLAYDVKVPFTEISLKQLNAPERGDIVIIDSKKAGKRLVKRIIGIPGDTILMQSNTIIINGKVINYKIISEDSESITIQESIGRSHNIRIANNFDQGRIRTFGPAQVPDGEFFVLGDNRDNSADSRTYSFIPRGELIGRSSSVIFSLDNENQYIPRAKRFFSKLD